MGITMLDYISEALSVTHKTLNDLTPEATAVDHIHGTNAYILESALSCISGFYCKLVCGTHVIIPEPVDSINDDGPIPEEIGWMLSQMDITETQELSVLLGPPEQSRYVYRTWETVCTEDLECRDHTVVNFNSALDYLIKKVISSEVYMTTRKNTQTELRRRYEDFPKKYPLATIIDTIDMYLAMEAARINYGVQAYMKLVNFFITAPNAKI